MGFEIVAHRCNDAAVLRRLLAAGPSSLEADVGVGPFGLVVAHEPDLDDASGLTVAELLAAAGDVPVQLEAKCFPPETPAAGAFFAALRPWLPAVAVCSFDEQLVAEIARRSPSTHTTFLFHKPLRSATAAGTLGPRLDLVTRELVEGAHAVGARVVPWTVNDARTITELIDLGVDGLVTDRPALARAIALSRLGLAA
jgi:glycerophosphoryl diester phosphodiesterase